MGNTISYIKWRGDFSFDQIPFNEVDNLILAEMSYLDFRETASGLSESGTILLKDADVLYQEKERYKFRTGACRLLWRVIHFTNGLQ